MDVLPPFAAYEARAVERLIAHFAGYGYERVKPPLMEFAGTLLAGSGAALAAQTFQLMDPVSQRMLALRPDMTMQVARIASSRLAHRPRPLRLGYAGQVLRVRGSQLRPERQFGQVGAEIVGSDAAAADIEVIGMATSALIELGVDELTVDLGMPNLVPAILASRMPEEALRTRLRLALDRKDMAAIDDLTPVLGRATSELLSTLVRISGPAEATLAALADLDLPPAAVEERGRLTAVHDGLRAVEPSLTLTIDAVESRGFEYHTGVTFAIFAAAVADEVGRGGRYHTEAGEPATGVTLFIDAVMRALPRPEPPRRVLLPADAPAEAALGLRRQGWVTVRAFDSDVSAAAEAARLACSHVFIGGEVLTVGAGGSSVGD
jgi:ATP phosphoribosyltransferase regulatory subunit